MPETLRWPFKHLEKAVGLDRIRDWYTTEQIAEWRADGLDDFEADRVAIHFGLLAHSVFQGWTEAGIDSDEYP